MRTFTTILKFIGIPIVTAAWALAIRLVWEQTVLSWDHGPQMVGFSLMHSGLGILLISALYGGLLWLAIVLCTAALTRSLGGRLGVLLLLAYALAWGAISMPYGFWQRMFIDKYSPIQATEFFTYAAAKGDLRTVQAFLDRGVDVNVQSRNGTALHGAAVQGELKIIEFLIAHGADVNAINIYGDTPMANAMQAREHATETQVLLAKFGGKLVRGSEEQRKRVIEVQVRNDIEEMDKKK